MDNNNSLWQGSCKAEEYPALFKDITADTLVVGGGLVGLLTAFLLQENGVQTVLIDAGTVGNATSAKNTGKLTTQHDDIYHKLLKHGIKQAADYYNLNVSGCELIAELCDRFAIPCDLQEKTAFIFTQETAGVKRIEEELAAYKKLGIRGEIHDILPIDFPVKKALAMPGQHSFNAFIFMQAIAQQFCKLGGRIYEHTAAVSVKDEKHCVVETKNKSFVTCKRLVIASHFPFFDGGGLYFTRTMAERSYIVASKTKMATANMFISLDDNPLSKLRSINFANVNGEDYLLVGGEGHRTGMTNPAAFEKLKGYAAEHFDAMSTDYKWSAQDYVTTDYIPYVGRLTKEDSRIFVATGFCKWGNSTSGGAAKVLKELVILGRNEFEEFLSPTRIESGFNVEYLKDNFESVSNLISGKLRSAERDFPTKQWDGKVVEVAGKKYGCCVDGGGRLHIVDITCPHLGCELVYNQLEHSWDCPCHASRFGLDGRVLEGPATKSLKSYGDGKNKIDPKIFD